MSEIEHWESRSPTSEAAVEPEDADSPSIKRVIERRRRKAIYHLDMYFQKRHCCYLGEEGYTIVDHNRTQVHSETQSLALNSTIIPLYMVGCLLILNSHKPRCHI